MSLSRLVVRSRRSLRFGVAASVALAAITAVLTPTQLVAQTTDATVSVTETGFQPSDVTIPVGGSITWTNSGANQHTVTSLGGSFDSSGMNPGQTFVFKFTQPGTYTYSSYFDCHDDNGTWRQSAGNFNCSAVIRVNPAATPPPVAPAASPTAAVAPTPTNTQVAPSGPLQMSVAVTITDTGFSPANVTIAAGGTVIFMNTGNNVHTVTTWPGLTSVIFDSGGLGHGQSFSVNLSTPGVYGFTSWTDCGTGNGSSTFNCNGYAINVVAPTPVPPSAQPPAPVAPAMTSTPLPANTIVLNDQSGFSPQGLTVPVGATVTWINQGSTVHSVVADGGANGHTPTAGGGLFDSGGLAPGQFFSFTFTSPGLYTYHSSTEASYQTDSLNGGIITTFPFTGSIIAR